MPYKDFEKARARHREYMRDWYHENKSKHIALVDKRRKEIIRWLREFKATLNCAECGEDHPACLDFHHNDPAKKEITLARLRQYVWSKERILKEVSKCTVLCSTAIANIIGLIMAYETTRAALALFPRESFVKAGGDEGSRTLIVRFTRPTLCCIQLSYIANEKFGGLGEIQTLTRSLQDFYAVSYIISP